MNKRRNWNKRKSAYEVVKRIMDLTVAIAGLLITLPIMLLIAIAIKLDSKGPIIFKQERTGKYGKTFLMWKFRTMVADNNVRDFSKQDEHTRVGTFLRRTSLDELPQFINVLRET